MILDLFAGPGGWDEGLSLLGIDNVVGIELDPDACATAEAAGHSRIKADIRTVDPVDFAGIVGLIASPPCQTFTDAGKGQGQGSLEALVEALRLVANGSSCDEAAKACGLDAGDPRTTLVLEPMRFIRDLKPRWIAFEEVVQVLPVWEGYADLLKGFGYSTWAGILNAANYGVPQSRKRSFMLASLDVQVSPPTPSHARSADEGLFDVRLPWVTMADALNWDEDACRLHNLNAPEPAHDPDKALWPLGRPATTVVRSFRPDVIAAPGYRQAGDGPRQNTPGSIGVTPEQMCILQGIRTDYPFSGSPTKQGSLIGAILPPPWAAAILAPLVDSVPAPICHECGNDHATYRQSACLDCLEIAS